MDSCALCQRVPRAGTTAHHLIPRTCHSNKWFKKRFTRVQMLVTVPLCRDCHKAVHRIVPEEKDLGREYHTLERLAAHPEVAKFVAYIRKQK
ncbi:MAG: hypothetical protein AAF517_03975 [Planctomycetota bacterium]